MYATRDLNGLTAHERRTRVITLAVGGTALPEALHSIAGLHRGTGGEPAPFRSAHVRAGEHFFPEAAVVAPLIEALLVRTTQLLAQSPGVADDARAGAYLLKHLLAIHPFENGNFRTAVDFTDLVLMRRWRRPERLLEGCFDAQVVFGEAVAMGTYFNRARSDDDFKQQALALATSLVRSTFQTLREEPAIAVLSHGILTSADNAVHRTLGAST